jgi:hypothetical protein
LFALGHVNHPRFEFAAEVQRAPLAGAAPPQDVGIFFCRGRGPAQLENFFVLAVSDGAAPPGAVLELQSWRVAEGDGGRGRSFNMRPLKRAQPVPLASPDGWHALRVEVRGRKVAIYLDRALAWALDTAELQRDDPHATALEPKGELGLWSQGGYGVFRNLTVTLFQPEEGGP